MIMLLFLQIFFSCWWNRETYITKNSCTNKPDLAAFLILILPDIISFLAFVLEMGHVLQDKLWEYRLEQSYTLCYDNTTRQILQHTAIFCILKTIPKDLTRTKNMTDYIN
jgi:hypothetical protein